MIVEAAPITESDASPAELARRYGVSRATIRRAARRHGVVGVVVSPAGHIRFSAQAQATLAAAIRARRATR